MTLKYMLDTDICIYIAKNKPSSVLERFEQLTVGEVSMSIVTYGELIYGAQKSQRTDEAMEVIEQLTSLIPTLPLPTTAAEHYGIVRNSLGKNGQIIGNNDLWIASHSLALETILVTNNTKEFSRINQLRVENWI